MLKSCLNPKVLVALVAVGVGVLVVDPGLFAAALPVLLFAACPLSMLLMGRMSHGTTAASGVAVYTCPMHADVQSDRAGRCPQCGMALVSSPGAPVRQGQADGQPNATRPTVEELQARLQAVTEQRAALAQELAEFKEARTASSGGVLEEAESIARAAAERR